MPKQITLDGAVMRNKLRNALANEIASMSLSTEIGINRQAHVTLDNLILRARKINLTAAKGEML